MDPQLSVDAEKDALRNLDKIYGKRLGALLRHRPRRTHGIQVSLRSDGFTRVGPVIRRLGMTEQQLVSLVATSIDEKGFRFEMMTYNDQKWVRARWGHTVEGVYDHLVAQPAKECFDQRRPSASEGADFVPFTTMVGRLADAVPAAAAASFAMPPEPPPALPACIGEMQEREMQEHNALWTQLNMQRQQIADMRNQINTLQWLLNETCMRRATSDVLRSNDSEWVWAWDSTSGNTRWSDRSDGNMPYRGWWSSDYNMPYHNGYHK